MRAYYGSRAPGPRADGTAILVVSDDRGDYPLPFVDQWEHSRRFYDDHAPVPDSPDSRRHDWGYGGSGAADTAASILADHLGEPAPRPLVQKFKWGHVAGLPRAERWVITSAEIQGFLDRHAALLERQRALVAEYQQFKQQDSSR